MMIRRTEDGMKALNQVFMRIWTEKKRIGREIKDNCNWR